MHIVRKYIFILAFILGSRECINAQINYPVNISPVIFQPFPSSIQYLNKATIPSLMLTITNKTYNATSLNVLLGVTVKTNSYQAQTKSITAMSPITLNGNTPTIITNLDIATLYSFSNLSGITIAQYQNNFPQSTITFGFVLYDAVTKRQVSQNVNYSIVYTYNDPPYLTLPSDKSVITEMGIQNILFQWQTRQSTFANEVQYIFQLVQMLDATQNPQIAFINNPIYFTDSTFSTTYLYGAKNPPLLPEKKYAWRIQAIPYDYGGFINTNFSNNGYSNIYSFGYNTPCKVPSQLVISGLDSAKAEVEWTSFTENQSFVVSIRKGNTGPWTDLSSIAPNAEERYQMTNLISNTMYQVVVKGVCNSGITVVSDPLEFKTNNPGLISATNNSNTTVKINASCGQIPPVKTYSQVLLSELHENDIITANDFSILITGQITGTKGVFSGKGLIDVWIGKEFKLPVSFQRIKINKNYELIEGEISMDTN